MSAADDRRSARQGVRRCRRAPSRRSGRAGHRKAVDEGLAFPSSRCARTSRSSVSLSSSGVVGLLDHSVRECLRRVLCRHQRPNTRQTEPWPLPEPPRRRCRCRRSPPRIDDRNVHPVVLEPSQCIGTSVERDHRSRAELLKHTFEVSAINGSSSRTSTRPRPLLSPLHAHYLSPRAYK